ncbi:LytR family transcriptional regulator [Cohnella endophytica]|uniref:LytR family transcriptional regulator n=1 Tax=Cohnella endophytica TaxID=2419778 RepID=A0A494XZR4_9BACL|nr:LCP family protein [Cohnella endophytica]RKP55248.1 LytR family transcriptional regulator [Cohnella endophytica]
MSQDTPLRSRSGNRLPPSPKASKPPGKKLRWGRLILIVVAVIILALASYAVYLYYGSWKPNLTKIAKQDDGQGTVEVKKGERAQEKPIALVLLGLDTRTETGSMNTDVMMVAAFNPKTKTATVVSIPRDSDLKLDGYKERKVNGYYAAFYSQGRKDTALEGDKATEYARGYARDETRQMLSKFTGISIDYTAVIDFHGFVDVVDALGGVKVTVDKDMRYVDSVDDTNIDLKKGEQELNGEQALGFVRYRKSNRGTAASSDFERNERQNQVLGAITDRMKSFSSVTKVDSLLDALGNNMRTDIPSAQIENIIKTYLGINRSDIRFIPLTGTWKSPYVYLDEDKLAVAKKALAEEMNPDGRPVAVPTSSPSASADSK